MTMYDNNIIWYNTAWWQLYMIYYIKITMSYGKKGMMTILYDTIIYDENVKWNNNLWWHDYMKQCYMMTKLQISKIPVLHLAVSSFLMLLTVSSPVCPMTSVWLCIQSGYRALSQSPDYGGSPIPGWTLSRLRECCGTSSHWWFVWQTRTWSWIRISSGRNQRSVAK